MTAATMGLRYNLFYTTESLDRLGMVTFFLAYEWPMRGYSHDEPALFCTWFFALWELSEKDSL